MSDAHNDRWMDRPVSEADAPADPETPQGPSDQERSKRTWRGLFGLICVILVVVLVLLMLRGCGGGREDGRGLGGVRRSIQPVKSLKPMKGAVSVWLKGSDISDVLETADIESDDSVDLGGGRFVVTVPAGSESDAVKALKEVPGVYDAGLVYER